MAHISGNQGHPYTSGMTWNDGVTAGESGVGSAKQYKYGRKQGGGFQFPGFGGGGKGGAFFSEADLARQLEYDRIITERSRPDVEGIGGGVRWNHETGTMTGYLEDDNQSFYDNAGKRAGLFGQEIDRLAGSGWKQMQQDRFDEKRALFSESDAIAEQKRLEQEQNTGASTTAKYWGGRGAGDNINRRNQLLAEEAFNESQELLNSSITRQNNFLTQRSDFEDSVSGMMSIPTPNSTGNMANVSTASTRWADNLAMEDFKKAKGKSDFFSSLMSGFSGGMFT